MLLRSLWPVQVMLLLMAPGFGAGLSVGEERKESATVSEASRPMLWQHWTREHGLPDNRVQGVLQTRDGYLWAATPSGMARFDGRQWESFTRANMPDMFTGRFCQMLEDADGILWVGTKSGLFRWNGRRFVQHALSLAPESLCALAVSSRGGIWCIANSHLSWLHDAQQETFVPVVDPEIGVPEYYGATEAAAGLWIGDSRGLMRFDWRTGNFSASTESHPRPFRFVAALEKDSAGVLWLLHGAGDPHRAWLSPYDSGGWRTNQTLAIYNGARPLSLFCDREGTLWFPNSRGSVAGLRSGRRFEVRLPAAAVDDFALAMSGDRDGGIWIGTEDTGLLRCQPLQVATLAGLSTGPGSQVWSLCEASDGGFWVGTDHGVSRFYQGAVTHFARAEGLSNESVRSVVEDRQGRIWIGTGAGLNWIKGGTVHRHQFPGAWFNTKVRALLVGRDDELWVGTAKGLHRLRLARTASTGTNETGALPFKTIASYGLTNGLRSEDIRALWEDQGGTLWVGTFGGGLHRFANDSFRPELPELASQSVWAIHERAQETLWLGTTVGLVRVKNGRARVLESREGLPHDVVNHILADERGQLWLGGEQGIYRFSERELNELADERSASVQGVAYDGEEGLPSRETNGQKNQPGAMRSRDGRLWFPGTKGVVIFDPARLPDQTNRPSVVIQDVRVAGESQVAAGPGKLQTRNGEVALASGARRSLEFHYTACAFVAASKLNFKYRLHGLEESWNDAGPRRIAHYANLKPGRYQFQVRAGNKYGIWNDAGAVVSFTLAPYYWETAWFRTMAALLFLLAAYGLYWRRILRHRRLADADRRAAVASERAEIARDLHDHLGPRFTMMQHLSQSLSDTNGPMGGDDSESVRRRLSRLAGELNASLDSAVWAVQPDKDTLRSLADYLGDLLQEMLGGTNIELELDFPEVIPPWPLSRSERYHLVLVVIEALNNTMKHARATLLRVRLLLGPRSFTLQLADNGSGLPAFVATGRAPSRPGSGLNNMRQRIERLGGAWRVTNEPGGGVMVELTLSPAAFRNES